MFFNFIAAFHIVWKNQDSCESWLVEFWGSRSLAMQTISTNNFFLHFWAAIIDLLITLKY